ncbi:hypothetical protein VPFG_00266 [Vibrio phage nt-1]|uniref:Uncharacterized protein n=1 Tax=Vibrio phage nt-1 TaxID=115992 RepID=R9TIQ5_9CAUD|nr:hypothetical protein VPFG_00266 [Vibrio phage nt-1]AGN30265.1 hypothetical protein VPFG_00266 [Vibrio phage nt-1]
MAIRPKFDNDRRDPPKCARFDDSEYAMPKKPKARVIKEDDVDSDKNTVKILLLLLALIAVVVLALKFAGVFRPVDVGDRYAYIENKGWTSASPMYEIVITDVNYSEQLVRYQYIGLNDVTREMSFRVLDTLYVSSDDVDMPVQRAEKSK